MTQETRKNFSQEKINIAWEVQGGCCYKCGRSLGSKFEADHKNGKHDDDSQQNCGLICVQCHDARAWETYIQQKTEAYNNLMKAVSLALDSKMSGALMDKISDALKFAMGLSKEINLGRYHAPPVSVRVEQYLETSGVLRKATDEARSQGLADGILLARKALEDANRRWSAGQTG